MHVNPVRTREGLSRSQGPLLSHAYVYANESLLENDLHPLSFMLSVFPLLIKEATGM